VSVSCDLHTLVERIVVSPTAPMWLFEVVRNVVDRYGLRAPILPSKLDLTPPWGLTDTACAVTD
jgi:hypothetical protein